MAEVTAKTRGWYQPLWLLLAAVLVVLLANAHLVYVAVSTQPECIPHIREKGSSPGAYRASNSAC